MTKKNLISQFNDLGEKESHPFKKRAYIKAAQIITEMSEEEFRSRNNFEDIEGIGAAINKKILQFRETGFIEKWKELQNPPSNFSHGDTQSNTKKKIK